MAKFNYQKRDVSTVRKRKEQWGNDRDSFLSDIVPIWKPSDGDNCIRILPPSWEGADNYGHDIYVHYGIGPDNSAYLDLSKMLGEPDPIHEAWQEAKQQGDDDYAKQLESKKRVLVYLIDRDKPKEGVMMWAMPWTVDKEIAIQSFDSRTQEALSVDDPDEGFDIILNRSGSGARTEYSIKIARNSSPLRITDEIANLLEEHPLPTVLNYFPYAHIKKAFLGGAKKPSSGDEQPSRGSKTETAPTHGRKDAPAQRGKTAAPNIDLSTLSWDDVQKFSGSKLDALLEELEANGIDIDPEAFETDEEMKDVICKELDLSKPEHKPTTRRSAMPEPRGKARSEPEPEAEAEAEDDPEPEAESEPAPPKTGFKDRLAALRNRGK